MMLTQLTIRQAEPDDAQEITALHAAGWREGYGALFEPHVLEQAIQERRTRWSDLLRKTDRDGTLLFVGERSGTIVTFAHAGPATDHPGGLEVYSFYAHPRHWGTGVAVELMHYVLDFARSRSYEHVYLSAYSRSERARSFYKKLGFRETGRTMESHLAPDVTVIDIEYIHDGPGQGLAAERRGPTEPIL